MGSPTKISSGCGCLVVLGFLGMLALFTGRDDLPVPPNSREERPAETGSFDLGPSPTIPGLAAVDVHGNLEKRGFTTKRDFTPNLMTWTCSLDTGLTIVSVDTHGQAADAITSVMAIVADVDAARSRPLAEEILPFIATLPYEGSTPNAARNWVRENLGRNTSRVFGPVKLELISNSDSRFTLRLAPVTEQESADQEADDELQRVEAAENRQGAQKRSREKALRDEAADREKAIKTARSRLRLARQAIDNDNAGALQRRWLNEVIETLPDSDEAREAAELLQELDK